MSMRSSVENDVEDPLLQVHGWYFFIFFIFFGFLFMNDQALYVFEDLYLEMSESVSSSNILGNLCCMELTAVITVPDLDQTSRLCRPCVSVIIVHLPLWHFYHPYHMFLHFCLQSHLAE